MNLSKKQIIIVASIAIFAVVIIVLVSIGKKAPAGSVAKLTVWGLEKRDAFDAADSLYIQGNPGVQIDYTQVSPVDYENTILKALAAGKGPDIFYVPSHSLPKLKDILIPLDPKVFSVKNFEDNFPSVASQDFISKGNIYAAPLYIDTLALIYNRDMFDSASIAMPPATWTDFQTIVPKLKTISTTGQITRAAAALGGTDKTISHATDLLSLLMLQNGAAMVSKDLSGATFGRDPQAASALNFYLDFSNPASKNYTWNEAQQSSLDSFAAENTAVVFGYKSDLDVIKSKNPYLHFGVASMPQVSAQNSANYASYQGLGVSIQSKQAPAAWNFIGFLTVNSDSAKAFSGATGHPPALRSLISQNASDPNFGVFANQALSARSWYIVDYNKVDDFLNGAIAKVVGGKADAGQALREAADSVSILMK
jgi:ABC-type glycerol-3-phosphate transport system substrate-binding protein